MADNDDTSTGGPGEIVASTFGGAQLARQTEGARKLLDDAKAGRWAIDEETGTHFKRGITQMQDRLAEIADRGRHLEQAPKLGNDPYARAVAQHFQHAMIGDDQALMPVLNKTRESLILLGQALDEAIKHYNAADDAATMHLGPFTD